MRKVICIATIENKKILLVRKRLTWILPGGKPENAETDKECLIREFSEELPKITILNMTYYSDKFVGITPHSNREIQAIVYIAKIIGEIERGAEINKAEWVKNPEEYNLSEISKKIIRSLRQTGHL